MTGYVSSRQGPSRCRTCGTLVDGATGEGLPQEGDASVCLYCATLSVFVATPFGLMLRAPMEEEDRALRAQNSTREALAAVRAMHARKP